MKTWFVIWMLLMSRGLAETWMVSPTGDDQKKGTADAPLKSLHEALRRAEKRSTGSAEIILKPGNYNISETCEIGPKQGNLLIHGEPGAVLSGFRNVPADAWKKPDTETLKLLRPDIRDKVLAISFDSLGSGDPGHLSRRGFNLAGALECPPSLLFVNGRAMPLASWPDEGTVKPGKIIDAGPVLTPDRVAEFYKSGGTFGFESDRLAAWAGEKDLWVDGVFGNPWEWSFNGVKKVDVEKRTITLAQGEVSGLLDKEWLKPYFRVSNALSEISVPGEVWYDFEGKRLLFYPPDNGDAWKATAAMSWATEPLLRVAGAENVRIEGLVLGGALDGLMEILNSKKIEVTGLKFGLNAGDGLVVKDSSVSLRGCRFEGCGGRGAILSGGDEASLAPSGQSVDHCIFSKNAWWSRIYRPALELNGVGQVVGNCTFEDQPHMAIELKGNNFVVENNVFRRITTGFVDMGAVYFNLGENPLRRGSIVRNNFFDDIRSPLGKRCAVYLDNATAGVRVEGNLLRNVGQGPDDWAVMVHGGGYNKVLNNVFLDCPLPCEVAFFLATWGVDMVPDYQKKWAAVPSAPDSAVRMRAYPEMKNFAGEDHIRPPGIVVSGNVTLSSAAVQQNGGLTVLGGTMDRVEAADNITLPTSSEAIRNLQPVPDLPEHARRTLDRWRSAK
ncbi:MAG: right-handed parallel beta-helix repeat-containing protein [Luteolibacter sp.]